MFFWLLLKAQQQIFNEYSGRNKFQLYLNMLQNKWRIGKKYVKLGWDDIKLTVAATMLFLIFWSDVERTRIVTFSKQDTHYRPRLGFLYYKAYNCTTSSTRHLGTWCAILWVNPWEPSHMSSSAITDSDDRYTCMYYPTKVWLHTYE